MKQVYFCQIATGRAHCLAEGGQIRCDLSYSTFADRLQSFWSWLWCIQIRKIKFWSK